MRQLPIIKRSLALFFILIILWRWYSHLMLHQLVDPPLHYSQYNLTFHIFQLFRLQDWLVANTVVALIFDSLLLFSFVWVFIQPKHHWINILAFILFFIYSVASPVNLAFPAHYLSGMVVMSFLLLCNSSYSSSFGIQGLRYYVLWVYASAFLWKMWNGALWDWNTGTAVLQSNLAQYLYLNPNSLMSDFYYWVLQNPNLVNVIAISTYLLEAVFIVGFFTKKYDYILMLFIIVIHFGLYLAVDTLFIEWYIFLLFLIPISKWQSWATRFPVLNR